MKDYIKKGIMRGLFAMGFGPIVLAIVYAILGATGTVTQLSAEEITLGILTVSLLAFVAGGITVVYRIEQLPLVYAVLLHGAVLYLDYLIIYLVNGWLHSGWLPLVIFTASFVVGYAVIWLIIYCTTRHSTRALNARINGST